MMGPRKLMKHVEEQLKKGATRIGAVVIRREEWDISDTKPWDVVTYRLEGILLGYLRIYGDIAQVRVKIKSPRALDLLRYCVEQTSEALPSLAQTPVELELEALEEVRELRMALAEDKVQDVSPLNPKVVRKASGKK
jgi:hypothetical protein